jgi:predicted CXXCH cytochrome family protein
LGRLVGYSAIGVAAATPAVGQWPNGVLVDQTPHNLTRPASNTNPDMAGLIRDYGEVCVYCHSPHGGPDWIGQPSAVLMNRQRPNAAYRMPEFGEQRMMQDPSPSDRSRLCLSCHDGTIGLDLVNNLPQNYDGPPPANHTIDECEGCHSGGNPDGGINWEGVWFRPDMRDQHPISVLYDASRRPGAFVPAIGNSIGGLPLYDGKVECGTCHEPHSQQFRYFLRRNNAGGALCLTCHTSVPQEPVHQ